MFDFRLKVFYTVAKRLNFTKAAQELYITQPAVTKHIKEIEHQLKVTLFDRNGTKIKLTPAGETMLQYAERIFELYRTMEMEIGAAQNSDRGVLRIGASTTIANYVLPLVLPVFQSKFSEVHVQLSIGNTEQIEALLSKKEIDLGITEGYSRSSVLKYTIFLKDEIVLVAAINHAMAVKGTIKVDELKGLPILLREPGSGTLEVIIHALESSQIKMRDLNLVMQLSSSESMKLYLLNSDSVAFMSVYSVLNELAQHRMSVIEVEGLDITRNFYFVQPQGQENRLVDVFMNFATHYNYK